MRKDRELAPGRYYEQPCVRTIWPGSGGKIEWIPVLGPVHSDREIIGFTPQHHHVDFRFLRKPQIPRDGHPPLIGEIFATPVSRVWPDVPDPPRMGVELDKLPDCRYPLSSYMKIMRRRFGQHYPDYPDRPDIITWLPALHLAYRDHRLKPDLICPHRGASLEGMRPDQDGCVTCPLHGLRWHLLSGQLRPREQT